MRTVPKRKTPIETKTRYLKKANKSEFPNRKEWHQYLKNYKRLVAAQVKFQRDRANDKVDVN